ncbi:hypothetical protein GWI33_020777 [Rhynchophorus ferrugineus]|uniref:Uncharacterized protein n=1 Tax=Rhynchophorus ferrugineus TaxID=354439 RepID=A0A834M5C8_RHYFE|nr:hypothetical protein GWI33_020777 [Rhynchophorus ferrugineus]
MVSFNLFNISLKVPSDLVSSELYEMIDNTADVWRVAPASKTSRSEFRERIAAPESRFFSFRPKCGNPRFSLSRFWHWHYRLILTRLSIAGPNCGPQLYSATSTPVSCEKTPLEVSKIKKWNIIFIY